MKKSILLVCAVLIAGTSIAQKSLEFGINGGLSSYLGDLKPQAVRMNQNALALGLQAKYNLNSLISARLSLSHGTIKGSDAKSDQSDLVARNLSFRSRITEFALIGEINILNFGSHKLNKNNRSYHRFSPYLFGGIAVFGFNPEAKYNGRWYDLQPLGTEGQDVAGGNVSSYKLTQISLPVGAGVKFELTPNIILGYELGWRKTFTDYLDDVSGTYFNESAVRQANGSLAAELAFRGDELESATSYPNQGAIRGNSENKDWYVFSTFSIAYKIFKTSKGKYISTYY